MDIKTMACYITCSYLSNKLSHSKKDQGVTKIHLSQGKHINNFSGTLPKENLTLELWVTLLEI